VYDLPSFIWTLVLAGVIGIPAATCAVLYRGATGIRRHGGPVRTDSILSSERVADTKIVRYATEAFIGSD
jgi:hypothetical protein